MLCGPNVEAGMCQVGPNTMLKVFSATKARDRDVLGETVTRWLREHDAVGVHAEVRQPSDTAFHCMSITVWYQHRPHAAPGNARGAVGDHAR